MTKTKLTLIGIGLAMVMVAGPAPVLAQDDSLASPSAEATEPSAEPASERRDLYLDLPYYIGGFEPEIVMTRGDEHFANLTDDDPTLGQLEDMLETVGAQVEDMVSGYALVSQDGFFAFVVGVRIPGVEQGSLAPAYMPILIGNLIDPSMSVEQIADKEVTTILSVGEDDEYVELFVYDEGDTVWIVQAAREVAEVTIDNLPDPLAAE